jgi:hypothetical protein
MPRSGFGPYCSSLNDLVFHRVQFQNHRAFATGRGHIEVRPLPPKPRMTVAVNVRSNRTTFEQIPERPTTNSHSFEAGIENSECR